MERHCDHRFDAPQIHGDHPVVIRHILRIQLLIFFFSSVNLIKLCNLLIRFPDRRKTSGFCRHNIDADPEIRAQSSHTRPYEFHDLILYITIPEYRADNRQRHILRAYSFRWFSRQVNADHFRHIDIISLVQKLLYQLRPALSHRHRSQRSITGMGIRAKDHPAASCQHFPRILMDDRLMRGNIDSSILLRTGKSKHMIILINRSAHRTKRIMAVRQHIRHRKFLQPRRSRRLYDPNKSYIMGSQFIKFYFQLFHVPGCIMLLQNPVSNRPLRRLLFTNLLPGLRL